MPWLTASGRSAERGGKHNEKIYKSLDIISKRNKRVKNLFKRRKYVVLAPGRAMLYSYIHTDLIPNNTKTNDFCGPKNQVWNKLAVIFLATYTLLDLLRSPWSSDAAWSAACRLPASTRSPAGARGPGGRRSEGPAGLPAPTRRPLYPSVQQSPIFSRAHVPHGA